VTRPPTSGQRLAVALAFMAGALSFAAAASAYFRTGSVPYTPLFGGLFMLALAIAGYQRLRNPPQ
jgi:hypothetical protein